MDPLPMIKLFDTGLELRMGQCHVRRWIDDIVTLVTDDADPLGTEAMATHHLSLEEAPGAYATFQARDDGMIKAVFRP